MSKPETAPCGSWKSPIGAADIARSSVGLAGVHLARDGRVYWLEMRPLEGGRYVIVRRSPDGECRDMIPAGFNARTRVHEYGGGSYAVHDGVVFFSNFADQRIYRCDEAGEPKLLTSAGKMRYADYSIDSERERLICVREDHTRGHEPVNTIVAVRMDADGDDPGEVLVGGSDFYSSPRVCPDGSQLAWLNWNHPNMPWDEAAVRIAPFKHDGTLEEARFIAGHAREAIVQPEWSPQLKLYYVSDANDWWNLYEWWDGDAEPLVATNAEFAKPHWVFGMSCYAFSTYKRMVCAYTQAGTWKLARIDLETREVKPIRIPFTSIDEVRADSKRAVIVGGSPRYPTSILSIDLDTGESEVLRRSTDLDIDEGYLSSPEAVEFPTEAGLAAHALLYLPKNKDFRAPKGEKPPLLVRVHGGPTHATSTALRLGLQYYTSRGFAVLDVNYGGSTGYGRAYRERLYGQWGVVDVDDSCSAATYVAARGFVDGKRMAITGGSAGGFTTLACLAFRDVFAAGSSHFGVSDCEILAKETHKFEAHYLDKLIGPYPEEREVYIERSPLHHLEGLRCPVIFMQGLEDKIVPPDQSEMMFEALKKKGVATAYVPFEGEQHGFRKSESIQRALEAELYFFSRVLGFDLADAIDPIPIENL